MKILIQKEKFLNALNIVNKALKKNIDTFPILECVLIDASKTKIILTCTDNKEITITTELEGEIKEKGISAIEGQFITNIIKNMPENSEIELLINDKKECFINLIGKDIKSTFQAKDEKSFPNSLSINKEKPVIINEYKLKKIIEKTSFSYDKMNNTENIIYKGVNFNVDKDKLIAKAMNSFTLSIINENLDKNFGNFSTIIPGGSLEELNKLLKGEVNKDVKIYFSDKNIAFEFDKTLVNLIIIPNKFIDTTKILNEEYSTKIIVNKKELIESLYRTTSYISDIERKPVIFDIKDEFMSVEINSIKGELKENINIKKTQNDLRIAFNPNQLINILNAIEDENISMYFSGPKKPVIIKDRQESYIYLLMAVNI